MNNLPFSLHPVSSRYLTEILQVYRQCEDFLALGPAPKASREMVLADLELSRQEGGAYHGIYDLSQARPVLVGVFDFVLAGFEGVRSHAYISLLMIAKPYRRGGLGRSVVAWFEEQISHDRQITAILANVQVNNPDGIRFWRRLGYRIVAGPKDCPDGTTVWDLRKDLSPNDV